MKKTEAKARADELAHDYSDDAIEEGVVRAHEAAQSRRVPEAQGWLSAVFVLVRKLRGSDGDD
jgi:hypothetical protein